jgi:oligosaccharide repeat unit polymerase
VNILGLGLILVLSIPLAAITLSRFDQRQGGAVGSVVYYIGQANLNFNNYGLDAGGIRHGDRTINLLKRVIDPYNTPKNFQERRDKYPDLKMDDNVFYTFVGDFTLDFGPWKTVLIFLIFNMLVVIATRARTDDQGKASLAFHQLLLLYMVTCIAMQGGFWLFGYADTAGLRLIALLMLYGATCITQTTKTT